jgi:hypothetical protein
MPAPRLSIVILTDGYATIHRVTSHLCAQTLAHEIELVAVCPSATNCEVPAQVAAVLSGVTLVESPLVPMGVARAAGVRAARAPVVVLGETHAFPAPAWAEQLLAAHDGPWDAVAPGMANGNPRTARSWSGLLMDYGRFLAERPAGPIDEPPAYNACWKRDVLLSAGEGLTHMLEPGGPLDAALAARGARFCHVPNARVAHLNVAPWIAWVAERYWGGRLFGSHRSREWSLTRRLVYFCGSALVPLVRFTRTRPAVTLARSDNRLPRGTLVAVAGGSVLWAIGEAAGYLAGEGHSEARMLEYELHKERYA